MEFSGSYFYVNLLYETLAIEQYFHVVLCIMLCKVVLTFKSVNEILE